MTDEDRIRLMEANLARMIGWAGAHDAKASFLFGVSSLMLGVLAQEVVRAAALGPAGITLLILPVLPLGLVFLFLFRGAFPRTRPGRSPGLPSLIFFGSLATLGPGEMRQRLAALDEPGYLDDLCGQSVEIAAIVSTKYQALQGAYFCLFVSLPAWVAIVAWLRLALPPDAAP